MKNKISRGFIRDNELVNVKELNDELEIQKYIPHKYPKKVRYSKTAHIDLETGEIIEDKLSTHRGQSQSNLQKSLKDLKDIIKLNSLCLNKILVLTLTYAKKQYCAENAQFDFNQFVRRLRRKIIKFGDIEFISMRELHKDNSYHIHAILFFNQAAKRVSIDNGLIYKLWGHGDVDVQRPRHKGYYTYFVPHFAREITEKNIKMHKKALRLLALPRGQKLYQCSKGIKRPKRVKKKYKDALEYITQKGFEFDSDFIYPSPIKNEYGNPTYHAREHYKKPIESSHKSTNPPAAL